MLLVEAYSRTPETTRSAEKIYNSPSPIVKRHFQVFFYAVFPPIFLIFYSLFQNSADYDVLAQNFLTMRRSSLGLMTKVVEGAEVSPRVNTNLRYDRSKP